MRAFIAAHAQERGHYQDGQENSQRRQGEPKPLVLLLPGLCVFAHGLFSGQWTMVSGQCSLLLHPMEGPAPAGFGKECNATWPSQATVLPTPGCSY